MTAVATTTMKPDVSAELEAMKERIRLKSLGRRFAYMLECVKVLTRGDTVEDALTPEQMEAARQVMDRLLTQSDWKLLNLRFGLESGKTLDPEECASEFNTTIKMFNEMERSVLRKLQHSVWQDRIRYAIKVMPEDEYELYDTATKIGKGELPMPTDADALRGVLIEALNLNPMYTAVLKNAGVNTVGDLVDHNIEAVKGYAQSRQDMFVEIITTLGRYGLNLHA